MMLLEGRVGELMAEAPGQAGGVAQVILFCLHNNPTKQVLVI